MKKYKAIIIDPPWEYDNPSAMVGKGYIQVNVAKQYETMTIEELRDLHVPADDNCLLFMWITNPILADGSAAGLVKDWGFKPNTILTWAKMKQFDYMPSMKNGYWFRSASEHVIFAIKGNVKRPLGFPAIPTWFPGRRLPHSVKPHHVHEYAELAVPDGPWLEMFARERRRGWDVKGNQAPKIERQRL